MNYYVFAAATCLLLSAAIHANPLPDGSETEFAWTVGDPILKPGPAGSFDEVAVKDPTSVFSAICRQTPFWGLPTRKPFHSQPIKDRCRSATSLPTRPPLPG